VIDFSRIRTYPLQLRANKSRLADFARPDARRLAERIPDLSAGRDLKALVAALSEARRSGGGLLWMSGAHPIKCGLGPILIRLMELGFVTHVATNGAAPIHDLEIALIGETSEDVLNGLRDGSFGMARETAALMHGIVNGDPDPGLGSSIGHAILQGDFPHRDMSVFAACVRLGIPVTVHSAIGTEVIHMHPGFDPVGHGRKVHADFQTMIETVRKLDAAGVVVNLGSGVILPEVFLRSLNIARNLGDHAFGFTTAVFDMERLYRPYENVVHRPTEGGGTGYYFVGQHELMLPLLYCLLVEGAKGHDPGRSAL
jgi:hypothetical protein